MKLLTEEIKRRLPGLRDTDNTPAGDKVCHFKLFNPCGSGTWWICEGEEQEDGDWLLFGLADGPYPEFGYFSLNEFKSIRLMGGLGIERDRHFPVGPMREVIPESVRRQAVLLRDTVDEAPVKVVDMDPIQAEREFGLRANFEPGDRVVNIMTGESWTVPE